MTTQVIFKTEEKLKKAALKKAKAQGITLKALLTNCLKDYVDGRLVLGINYSSQEVKELLPTASVQKKMDKIATLLD